METPGPIIASLVVTDANGGRSVPGHGVSLEAYSDPTLSTLLVSPASVGVNGTVTFNATLSGGSGSDTFNWTGLPTGCTSEGSAAVCHPGQTGVFHVTLSATDGNGYSVTSSVATLAVGAGSGPLGGPGGAILGVSAPLFYVLAGAAALLLAGVAALALLRRKRT
jgi:hypothetical protein